MLLWIVRPGACLVTACHKCGSTWDLAVCVTCSKPVCPHCRWGTGDISAGYQCLRCEPQEADHAFSNLRNGIKKEMNTFTRQAQLMVFLLGFMLGSSFWALVWSIYKDIK